MAGLATLTIETELLGDAALELWQAHEALRWRHGDRYRKLERDIEDAFSTPSALGSEELEPGRLIFIPPASWMALIRRARALDLH